MVVDDTRLTSAAGGDDDGPGITVGGLDDLNDNPADPFASGPDDELYSLLPFLSPDAPRPRLSISTFRDTGDNFAFLYFVTSRFAVVGEGIFLEDEVAENEVGSDHTLTATVLDSEGLPRLETPVTVSVVAGPNEGAVGTCELAVGENVCLTDPDGVVTFTYTGTGGPGTDAIVALFTDVDGNPIASNPAFKTWIETLEITLAPVSAANPVDTYHTVTATVTTAAGDPKASLEVTFEVINGPNQGTAGTALTDDDGMASFLYPGTGGSGTDEIVAAVTDAQGDLVVSNTVTKEWLATFSVVIEPTAAVNVVAARQSFEARVIDDTGTPRMGVGVTFTVDSGPNAGTESVNLTDDEGIAFFTYAGLGGPGEDEVTAAVVDDTDMQRLSNTALVTWTVPVLTDPRPNVAVGPGDTILVVREVDDGGFTTIVAEFLGPDGEVLASTVVSDETAVHRTPAAAYVGQGRFAVIYVRGRPFSNALVGRFLDVDGTFGGPSFVIDDTGAVCDLDPTGGRPLGGIEGGGPCPIAKPAMAGRPTNGAVVVWQNDDSLFGRILRPELGRATKGADASFVIAAGGPDTPRLAPAVDVFADNTFVVSYEAFDFNVDEAGASAIRQARFSAAGELLADVGASLFNDGLQVTPAVAAAPDGLAVSAWTSFAETGSGIFGRIDSEDPAQPEIQLNTEIVGDQVDPALAVEANGLVAAVWLDDARGVYAAQRLVTSRYLVNGEVEVALSTVLGIPEGPTAFGRPAAAALADGRVVVVGAILGTDDDPDGGAAVGFIAPSPAAICFDGGRLVCAGGVTTGGKMTPARSRGSHEHRLVEGRF